MGDNMKTCSKCGEEKELFYFYVMNKSKDGRSYMCKECILIYAANNRERRVENSKKYYYKNKDRIKKYRAKNRKTNKEKQKVYSCKYRLKNKDKIKVAGKLYREKNKGKIKVYNKNHRKRMPESKEQKAKRAKKDKLRSVNDKELLAKNRAKYRKTEKGKKTILRLARKGREELQDGYIRSRLTNGAELQASDIPIELVELKREQLKLSRELRQK